MFSLKEFIVPFVGLKLGKHKFDYKVGNEFFEAFDYGLIGSGQMEVEVILEKMSTMMIFNFKMAGTVKGDCDVCLDSLDVELSGENRLIVKFGEDEFEETEEILVIPHGDYEINLSRYLYEFIHLLLPTKMVHEEGQCDPDVLERLEQMRPQEEEEDSIDPRWAALKDLNKKK